MQPRRPAPITFRDATGAAAPEYLGILLVVALVVTGLNGAVGGSGAGIGSHLHNAICRITNPATGSGCQSATAAAPSARSVIARRGHAPAATNLTKAGATTSALKAPAAATAPPTTATGPDGETVVLTSCGPKQVGPTDTQVAADGTQTGWRTTTYGCVDATGATRACSTRDSLPTSPSQWITLSIRSCSAPITDPAVAKAVFDHGADPSTVATDDCGVAVGMTPQAKAAVDKTYGPPPSGPALDTAVDEQLAVFATHVTALTGLDASDPRARAAFQQSMNDINTVVTSKGAEEFPVISRELGAVYSPPGAGPRRAQVCLVAGVYFGLIAAPTAIGAVFAYQYNKNDANYWKKAGFAIASALVVSTGFTVYDLRGRRLARLAETAAAVRVADLEAAIADRAGDAAAQQAADAARDAAIVANTQAIQDLAAVNQAVLGQLQVANERLAAAEAHNVALHQQMHDVQQHLVENGYAGPPPFATE